MTILEISDLSKHYGEGADRTDVLSGINLKVEEGEFIAIVGFSGSGKTTLMGLIAGRLSPSAGRITFQGRDITRQRPDCIDTAKHDVIVLVVGNAIALHQCLEDVSTQVRTVHVRQATLAAPGG